MTTRIGLAIGRGAVRGVMTRRHRIVWSGEVPLASVDELEATITALLANAPRARWPRPVVQAAIGPHGAQVKRVVGLPEGADANALTAIIREAAGTYFLKNGVPLLTTGVQPAGPGVAIAAALDRPYIEAVRGACRTRGWRVALVAPTAVALTRALAGAFHWRDGTLTIEATRTHAGAVDAVRTRPARDEDTIETALSPLPALAPLGDSALRFADAFGAAALDSHEPLAVHADRFEFRKVAWPHGSLPLATAIVLTGMAAVGLSPLAAKWAGRRALAHVQSVRPGQWQVISTSLRELDRVSATLRQARAFTDSRTSISLLLGELARSLPERSAVLGFDWTDGQGEITVVTPNPTGVLSAVRRLPGVGSVELLGSVGRQTVAGQDLQRVTVRFARSSKP